MPESIFDLSLSSLTVLLRWVITMPNELINVPMTIDMINNNLVFLNRTDLKGAETISLMEIVNALNVAKISSLKGGGTDADEHK